MGNLIETTQIEGPADRTVRVRFYDDDSMRIELPEAGPMVITEAFLSGKDHTVVIKLDPKTRRRAARPARAATSRSPRTAGRATRGSAGQRGRTAAARKSSGRRAVRAA